MAMELAVKAECQHVIDWNAHGSDELAIEFPWHNGIANADLIHSGQMSRR